MSDLLQQYQDAFNQNSALQTPGSLFGWWKGTISLHGLLSEPLSVLCQQPRLCLLDAYCETVESQSFAETRLLLMFFPNSLELYFICIFAPIEMLYMLTGHKFMSRNFFLSLFTSLGGYFQLACTKWSQNKYLLNHIICFGNVNIKVQSNIDCVLSKKNPASLWHVRGTQGWQLATASQFILS